MHFLQIDKEIQNSLDGPFTREELNAAVKSLQTGKTLGLDGFSSGFLKKNYQQIIPYSSFSI